MVSALAKGDYEDLLAAGLPATLEDFDRLNQLALRLTDGAETTVANFPRIGWAGDVPFYQPTCAAFAWYLEFVDREAFSAPLQDSCWFYALAHGRERGAFDALTTPAAIESAVTAWLKTLPVARDEIVRACRYATEGFNDAAPGKTDARRAEDAAKTAEDKREESLANLTETVSIAAAATGIAPGGLAAETPSRLVRMIDAAREMNTLGGGGAQTNKSRLTADYQLAFREIKKRLTEERDNG